MRSSIDRLRDYVAIPSVNPMGRSDIPAEWTGERRYAERVRDDLRSIGLDAALVGAGERTSVVAEARVPGAHETVLVASHLDTVPVDAMTIDPFDPRIEAGRLQGRGSCDTKGGMAALVAALERLLARGALRRSVVVVGEADEELGGRGVDDVLAHLGGSRPDWALATEPTGLEIVTHRKGIAVLRLEASGVAAHGSRPEAGRSAIVELSRAVLALEALRPEFAKRPDPVLGPASCSVGVIGGGKAPNVVPDSAWLLLDRRLLPGEGAEDVTREIEQALARASIHHVSVSNCWMGKPPLAIAATHAAVLACRAALSAAGLRDALGVAAFGTDAASLAARGIPALVMGPGSVEQAHTADEWVEVAQVEAMERFFERLLGSDA